MIIDPEVLARRKIDATIIDFNIWAIGEGLEGTEGGILFDRYCERLFSAGFPLWRASVGMRTLHPQWGGHRYVWWRGKNALESEFFERSDVEDSAFTNSPFHYLANSALVGGETWLRRRLVGPDAKLDFPILPELRDQGATDYFAAIYAYGRGDPSYGYGVVYSFTTDRPSGYDDENLTLLQTTLPALSLAMKSLAGHQIASSLLGAYLGDDAGRRVHSGEIARGAVETRRAVLWFADIRGFTSLADRLAGPELIELLNDMLECMTAPVRSRGGQVLKFLGDGVLATFPFDPANCMTACAVGLEAAREAMRSLESLNVARAAAGKPVAVFDLALHLGDVLYGNIGAVDRLDFTVIGPAVNEVSRIEALCEGLGQPVLISAELAEASKGCQEKLRLLGRYELRGVREPRDIYALEAL